jgi:hypothetical protein
MTKLVILGTLHQELGHSANSEFRAALTLIIEANDVGVIFEEWSDTQPKSFANHLAEEFGLKWADIGTPNLSKFQTYDPVINALGFDPMKLDAVRVPRYGPLPAQRAREEAMITNIVSFLPNSWSSGLLIVGASHLHSMMDRLAQTFEVEGFSWLPKI